MYVLPEAVFGVSGTEWHVCEIRSSLFKLNDENLFESLAIIDISHVLYSSLRGLEIIEEEMCGKPAKMRGVDPRVLKGVKDLYSLSKAGRGGVPGVNRSDLKTLRRAIIDRWVDVKTRVEAWAEKNP